MRFPSLGPVRPRFCFPLPAIAIKDQCSGHIAPITPPYHANTNVYLQKKPENIWTAPWYRKFAGTSQSTLMWPWKWMEHVWTLSSVDRLIHSFILMMILHQTFRSMLDHETHHFWIQSWPKQHILLFDHKQQSWKLKSIASIQAQSKPHNHPMVKTSQCNPKCNQVIHTSVTWLKHNVDPSRRFTCLKT